jgi:hypothetical protein
MSVYLLSEITFYVTLLAIGLNIYQVVADYAAESRQISFFSEAVQNQEINRKNIIWMNAVFFGFFPTMYLILLYISEFAYWLLAVIGFKFLAGTALNGYIQMSALDSKPFTKGVYFLTKVDNILNILVLSFVLKVLLY